MTIFVVLTVPPTYILRGKVAVSTTSVKVGQSFSIIENQHFMTLPETQNAKLSITDSSGSARYYSSSDLLARAGLGSMMLGPSLQVAERTALRDILSHLSGFVDTAVYQSILSSDQPLAQTISCTLGLSAKAAFPPPFASSATQSYTVLPSTPAGMYTIHITSSYYCGTGPVGDIKIHIQD